MKNYLMGSAIAAAAFVALPATASAQDQMLTPAPTAVECWNGCMKLSSADCPPEPVRQVQCPDGSIVDSVDQCVTQEVIQEPVQQQSTFTCSDGTLVYDANQCRGSRSGETLEALCGQEYRLEMVYYEFDKGQSAETQATVNRILDIGESCNVENVNVVGHTDTSGSAAYNLTLSKKRAKDVRADLIAKGIDASRISSEGKGETSPFIDTGDNKKEPLNRRTEITIKLGTTGGMAKMN